MFLGRFGRKVKPGLPGSTSSLGKGNWKFARLAVNFLFTLLLASQAQDLSTCG
jgi:hypothetical protein